jgi:hypothetical protein
VIREDVCETWGEAAVGGHEDTGRDRGVIQLHLGGDDRWIAAEIGIVRAGPNGCFGHGGAESIRHGGDDRVCTVEHAIELVAIADVEVSVGYAELESDGGQSLRVGVGQRDRVPPPHQVPRRGGTNDPRSDYHRVHGSSLLAVTA